MTLLVFSILNVLANTFAKAELPDAPSVQAARPPAAAAIICRKVFHLKNGGCIVKHLDHEKSEDEANKNNFYINVMMSWEHSFGEKGWEKKVFYNGAYRVVDKNTGRQYDLFRFDNEQGIPVNVTADSGTRTVRDSDYINSLKVYQTQQKGKDGKFSEDDDDLDIHSKFIGQVVDENDYDRRYHYFIAIPIGWDRGFQRKFGAVDFSVANEIGLGGIAYAGIFTDDGRSSGNFGANIARTVNSASFEFTERKNSFTVTPIEFTNDCSAFKERLNCEWEASGVFDYVNEPTEIGFETEFAHKTGLSAFQSETQSENIMRIGVSIPTHKLIQVFHTHSN